ncbi:MAG: alpha/beta hydrolase-fold protein [Myxococcota bacterium]
MKSTKLEALIQAWNKPDEMRRLVEGSQFPLVDGSSVSFVYLGGAERVLLRHWVYGLETSTDLIRAENTDLWYLTLEFPPASRVEYKLEVIRSGRGDWIEDPLNPRRAHDPFGANSVLTTGGYEEPRWIHHDPVARPGQMNWVPIDSAAFGSKRSVQVYEPARLRLGKPVPLVVVHDGSDYLRFTGMRTILDNLIHRQEIESAVYAFIDSPDRLREYADSEAHAAFLTTELWPTLAEHYPLIDQPYGRCLMGASFGGVASFSAAARHPGFWGKLLLQSGSFAFTDIGSRNRRGPLFDRVVAFVNRYRDEPSAVSQRVFMSCGVFESLIYENRSLAPMLASTGMQVRLVEARDGHNWHNWRDRLREGLSWLFPGGLLFVYE